MAGKTINVGLIGYGFMGKAHSNGYLSAPRYFNLKAQPVLKVVCGLEADVAAAFAAQWGWETSTSDWREVVARDDIDLVDISTPNNVHKEIAVAAAKAGKHIVCEKPLAMNAAEGEAMVKAASAAKVVNMVNHNYRRVPAIALAKQMIDAGELGDIYHFRAVYLQDWITDPNFPLVWRLRKELTGSGVHGDLNAHIIDLALWLVGPIAEVTGMMKTFITERPLPAEEGSLAAQSGGAGSARKMGKVTVDDATAFLARFTGGAMGTFESSRFGTGRRNGQRFEINGSKGSIVFELERLNELQFYNHTDATGRQGFRLIHVTEPSHPYIANYWPAGHIIGWEHTFINAVADVVNGIVAKKDVHPTFADGLATQKVLDAVEESANTGAWVHIG
ncbi:MAG: Gfo/Idh/MocA family oxidoreductase [Verrucomicrobia bacterium]|nr:Gfo/Idh/MocA family oxidoreductase [Verrucomicrobiota bacterium]